MTQTSADQQQQVAAERIDQEVENLGDGGGAGGQPRQKFRRMPLRVECDALAHQLGEQPALVVGEDGVGDLRKNHGVAVGRRALEDENQDGEAGQQRDAAHVLVDIGLVDDLAENPGRARGRRRRHRHQHEGQQIAPPVGEALFGDQAANQRRRAIGIVSDFPGKFGHPRSIDSAGRLPPACQGWLAKRPSPCPLYAGFSSQIRACAEPDFRPKPPAAARHGARGTISPPRPARGRRWCRDRRIAGSSPGSSGCGWCPRSWS